MQRRFLYGGYVALVLAAGCASSPLRQVSFQELRSVREVFQADPGGWTQEGGVLRNAIPADVTPQELAMSKEGVGISLALVQDFEARDLIIEAELAYQDRAAASIVFRAVEHEGVVLAMYMLVLNSDGVHLWVLTDHGRIPLYHYTMRIPPLTPHTLAVEAQEDTFTVWLNGKNLFTARDRSIMRAGGAGICAREGVGQYDALRVKALDTDTKTEAPTEEES